MRGAPRGANITPDGGWMLEPPRRSPFVPLARIATLVALGDLMTKQVALLWIGAAVLLATAFLMWLFVALLR